MSLSVNEVQDLVQSNPLIAQIAVLYYKESNHEYDRPLADWILTQAKKIDFQEYYKRRLFEEAGVTEKEWDRAARRIMYDLDVEEDPTVALGTFSERIAEILGIDEDRAEEIGNIESSISELDFPIGPDFKFQRKMEAVDALMHNYHAGIAPFEVLGVSRKQLRDLAEFLSKAGSDELKFVVSEQVDSQPTMRRPSREQVFVRKHGRKIGVYPGGRYYRERQFDPSLCQPGTSRTVDVQKPGHKAVVCRPVGLDTTRTQSVLHPRTVVEARKLGIAPPKKRRGR